jgi:archaellum component FlaG (FlaF/FlaG flagellin family)
MDKAITTTFLIIISMVMAIFLFNSVYPAVIESGDAMNNLTDRTEQQLKSQIGIIHAVGELDKDGWWQDINNNGSFDVLVWVKNIGATRIVPLEKSDIFFGPEGNFVRIPHQSEAGGTFPYWTSTVENAAEWVPTATVRITIHHDVTLASGRYYIKVTTPNGTTSQQFFGM